MFSEGRKERKKPTKTTEIALLRGEKIESLTPKLDDLAATNNRFRKSAMTVKHKMWWKNAKVWVLMFFVFGVSGVLFLYCFDSQTFSFLGGNSNHCHCFSFILEDSSSLIVLSKEMYILMRCVVFTG